MPLKIFQEDLSINRKLYSKIVKNKQFCFKKAIIFTRKQLFERAACKKFAQHAGGTALSDNPRSSPKRTQFNMRVYNATKQTNETCVQFIRRIFFTQKQQKKVGKNMDQASREIFF